MTETTRRSKVFHALFWLVIVTLFTVGIYLIIKPFYKRHQRKKLTQQLSDMYDEYAKTIEPRESSGEGQADTEEPERLEIYPTILVDPRQNPMANEEEVWVYGDQVFQQLVREADAEEVTIRIIGQVNIPEIDLHMPLLDNSDYVTIRYGLGRYTDTKDVGENGNTVIFGHRMLEPGQHLHDIDKLDEGDEITIHKDGKTYVYRMTHQKVIQTEQIYDHILNQPKDHNQLIFATCDPIPTWEDYLLVYADLVEVRD